MSFSMHLPREFGVILLLAGSTVLAGVPASADSLDLLTLAEAQSILAQVRGSTAEGDAELLAFENPSRQRPKGYAPDLGWRRSADIAGGAATVVRLEDLRSKELSACTDDRCSAVFATPAHLVEGFLVRALAYCQVDRVAQSIGSPRECVLVQAEVDGGIYLRVVEGWRLEPGFGALPDFDVSISTSSKFEPERFRRKLAEELARAPLNFETDPARLVRRGGVAGRRVIGVVDGKFSRLIGDWVWATVRIDLFDSIEGGRVNDESNGEDGVRRLDLVVATDLLVNQQNTTRDEDWHRPAADVHARFQREVKLKISDTLRDYCATSNWMNAVNVVCATAANSADVQPISGAGSGESQ